MMYSMADQQRLTVWTALMVLMSAAVIVVMVAARAAVSLVI